MSVGPTPTENLTLVGDDLVHRRADLPSVRACMW